MPAARANRGGDAVRRIQRAYPQLYLSPTEFRERSSHRAIRYEVVEARAPALRITRISDPTLPFGGRWIFELVADGAGTRLTITEDGFISNPVFPRALAGLGFGGPAALPSRFMGEQREESQGFFEMLWDCDHCGAQGLLGKSQRYCANCGAPQNPDKRYFPKEGDERRVDGHSYEGSDRLCPACNSPQSARAKNCTHCGSVLDGASEVRGIASSIEPDRSARPARRRRRIWPFVVGILVLFGGSIWWRCLRSQEAQVAVTGHAWKRVIAIEQFAERPEEAWRNEVPAAAGFPVCHERERSKRQVEDGEECKTERRDKKDGTFEQVKKCKPKLRSEPVMDSWCRFTMRRWAPATAVEASGRGLSPAWPSDAPPADTPAALGAKRQGKRTETLTLEFRDHGTCDVSDAVWRKYTDGQNAKVEVRASSGDVVCSSL